MLHRSAQLTTESHGRPRCSHTAQLGRAQHHRRSTGVRAAASSGQQQQLSALILEADGVLCDLHMDGHRQAFNRAFHELGMDCANWTPAIYHDLLSRGDGTGEGLVAAYYACVGWPTFLPTAEQAMFAGKVHQLKQEQFKIMLQKGELPLRDGVVQVMADAVAAGAQVAVVTETASQPSDDVISCLLAQLPPDLAAAVRVYSTSMYGSVDDSQEEDDSEAAAGGDAGGSSGLQAGMAAAASRVKQRGAREFVARMATALQGKQAGVLVQLDPALQHAGAPRPVSAAWLAAVAATLGAPPGACLAAASSGDLVAAAAAAGMVAVAVPRKLAYAATYPAAAAKFEGLGPGTATWQKLSSVWQRRQQQHQ